MREERRIPDAVGYKSDLRLTRAEVSCLLLLSGQPQREIIKRLLHPLFYIRSLILRFTMAVTHPVSRAAVTRQTRPNK